MFKPNWKKVRNNKTSIMPRIIGGLGDDHEGYRQDTAGVSL